MKKIVILVVATLVVISVMYFRIPKEETQEIINVSVRTPIEKNISDYINADGRIKEGNKRNIHIKKLSGIEKVFVKEGETVRKGQVLFSLEPIGDEFFSEVKSSTETSGIYEVFKSYGIELPQISDFTYVSEEENIITSPIDGIITDLNVSEGENANPAEKLITVSDFSDLYIEILVPEAYSSRVHAGGEVMISAEALGNTMFSGKIESVKPTAMYIPSLTGEGKTYVSAVVRPKSTNKFFRPELSVKAKIAVNTANGALTVPYECIRQDDNGVEYVFCVDEENTVYKQKVECGHELENEVEIKSGIKKTDKVIFEPSPEVKEGMKVSLTECETK